HPLHPVPLPRTAHRPAQRRRRVPLHLPVLGTARAFAPPHPAAATERGRRRPSVPPPRSPATHPRHRTPPCPAETGGTESGSGEHWWFHGCVVTVRCPIVAARSR